MTYLDPASGMDPRSTSVLVVGVRPGCHSRERLGHLASGELGMLRLSQTIFVTMHGSLCTAPWPHPCDNPSSPSMTWDKSSEFINEALSTLASQAS